jgi:hypothetical protein
MKKTFLALSVCFLMCSSNQVLAQNDSSRAIPTTKVSTDSIFKVNDTLVIGNMLIVKKQGDQSDYKNLNRRNLKKPYGTSIHIVDGKSSKDTFLWVNDDTVKLGRLQIIKSQDNRNKKNWESMFEDGDFENTNFTIKRTPKKLKNIETNWWILDIGLTNFIDKSPSIDWLARSSYALPYSQRYLITSESFSLNNRKSTNVNIWVVTQKLNLIQHKINLKYGLGIEMFNFRFDKPVSFREDVLANVTFDDVSFTKNKLLVKYLTVPLQLNFSPNPTNKKAFYASIGMSAGYLWNAKNKQISPERGKEKYRGSFNLNDWRFATIGELGIGSLRLYGSFANNNLFNKDILSNIDMQPFAVGLRFSKF